MRVRPDKYARKMLLRFEVSYKNVLYKSTVIKDRKKWRKLIKDVV